VSRKKLFAPFKEKYAYGWYVLDSPEGRVAQHGGTVDGFETDLHRWLDRDASTIVLANRDGVGWQIGYSIAAILFGRTGPRRAAPPAIAKWDAALAADLVGTYELPGGGTIHVRADGDALVLAAEGQSGVAFLKGAASGARGGDS